MLHLKPAVREFAVLVVVYHIVHVHAGVDTTVLIGGYGYQRALMNGLGCLVVIVPSP